jgi:hypothetical protein
MTESGPESIDDLVLGTVKEGVTESDEKFKARVAAAQAKLAKIKKDESKTKDFDIKLSKLISKLAPHTLKLVVFLIDSGVPSLTILAMISLDSTKAEKICHTEFHKFIEELADFSDAKLKPELEKHVAQWWTYMFAADQVSVDTKLASFHSNAAFVEFVSLEFNEMVKRFLTDHETEHVNQDGLNRALKKYETMLFSEKR